MAGSCAPRSLSHTDRQLKSVNQHNFTLLVLHSLKMANVKSGNTEGLLHVAQHIKLPRENDASVELEKWHKEDFSLKTCLCHLLAHLICLLFDSEQYAFI